MNNDRLNLQLRSQSLHQDDTGHKKWLEILSEKEISGSKTALLLCDIWNTHWSRGAVERIEAMIPRMNQVVKKARDFGMMIVHAPSNTLDFYAESPARKRILNIPLVYPPDPLEKNDPPQPIDASDGGSDTGEIKSHKPWSRQHPGIEIDQKNDVISEKGIEVYSFLCYRKINFILIMGVHANMCILNRSFGIKQMVKWGQNIALIRDLTDAMYNPAKPPYVSQKEGTQLVIGYIEKFWCPTLLSDDLAKK